MKKKEVMIEMKGVYTQDDESDTVEFVTTGTYYQQKGNYVIAYDESEMTGLDGCHTTLTVEGERCVTMTRSAPAPSQLIIERGTRHQCHYDTGMGSMTIGVSADKISACLDENGGNLEFAYSLDINTTLASENNVCIKVTPAQPAPPLPSMEHKD